jgi:hypothetical protein
MPEGMRFLLPLATTLASVGLLGCSSESGAPAAGTQAGTANGGAVASGGVTATGGNASAGSAGVAGATAGAGAGGTLGNGGAGGAAGAVAGGNAGTAGLAGAGGQGGGSVQPDGKPTFVAVGYAGRRVRSLDAGMTWTDEQTLGGGGDDEFLLRAVGFGKGVFVALGWKILSSPDGKTWTEHPNPQHQWLGGVQFGGGSFLATGGYGYCASSGDGLTWQACKSIPNNEASRSLAFGAGKFVTATDPGNWFESAGGEGWTLVSGGHQSNQVAYCGALKEYAACSGAFNARGRASAAGTTIRLKDGKLERSTNDVDFAPVAGSPSALEDIAVGFLP